MYFLADPAGDLPPDEDSGVGAAAVTGFLGMRAPWSGTILTGTKYGPVRLTVEIHDEPVSAEGVEDLWSEVVEVGFRADSGEVEFRTWGGERISSLELLPPGWWRLRAHARGRDEAHDRSWDPYLTEEPAEEHLIQFWPGPDYGDLLVVTRDQFGRDLREQLTPQ
jgi:hypothetical protein